MEKRGGYAGNILYVDLSGGTVVKKPLKPEWMKSLLGGSGINALLAYELIKPAEDPLSPGNALIVGAGPFVGTLVPAAGKCGIVAKSPASGFFGWAGAGSFGKLKFAGYDHLVVTGKADKPVYLKIYDDEVEIRDAAHIWGKDTWEATDIIWDELGKEYSVLCTGQAGENLVSGASVIGDKYAAFARTGLGAVMGSKNLKAIAAYGTRGIGVADVDRFTELLDKMYEQLIDQPVLKDWRLYGTLISLEPFAKGNFYPRRNFQEVFDADELLNAFKVDSFLENIKSGDVACMGCPIGCKHFLELKTGKYAGLALTVSCANAALQAWGCYSDIKGWDEVFRSVELCNRLGLDYYDAGNLIAWAIELYQRGIIDKNDTGGLELDWGNADVVHDLIQKIAYREGFGGILAQGLVEAPKQIGRNSQDYISESKGLGIVMDPRVRLSVDAFSHLTNVRGGHDSAVTVTIIPGRSLAGMRRFAAKMGFPPEDSWDRVLDGPEGYNPARITRWFEDNKEIQECFGVCQFAPFQIFNLSFWADIYSALTGIEMTSAELLKAGERIWNIKRAFNLREGASRKDDTHLHKRFATESINVGKEIRGPLTEEDVAKLMDEYYDERGWNLDGTIPEAKIEELGLKEILV